MLLDSKTKLDITKFFQAANPAHTLDVKNPQDRSYYIDFSSVRGGQIIEELKDNITLWSPNEPTCQLFTGHIGCGKSTELLRLKDDLEKAGFLVVYFDSSQDLDMGDVDVGDILLVIAQEVSKSLNSLETISLEESKGLKDLIFGLLQNFEISFEGYLPGVPGGKVTASSQGQISLNAGIATITAKAKNRPDLRSQLRDYLGPRTKGILETINHELLEPAIKNLKQNNYRGLVVIVDSLDRVDASPKPWGRPQPEYLFMDRADQLKGLHCHLVYTMPLALRFSQDYATLTQRFLVEPKILPMVPIQRRDGSPHLEGMALLQQMVLARAFPELTPEERLETITEIFDTPETLNLLCSASGGHVRNLLRLLTELIKKDRKFPLSRANLENVMRAWRNQLILTITPDDWPLLRQVKQTKKIDDYQKYQNLIRGMSVYEYRSQEESWFDVNPILAEAPELKS
jgi:hypothetical protein